jgi:hypothetical protein
MRISGAGLAFPGEINNAFAKPYGELKMPEKVDSKKPVYATLGRQVVTQDIQTSDFLADSRS